MAIDRHTPLVGSALYEVDGRRLGVVVLVGESAFQVSLDDGEDCWLPLSVVFTVTLQRTTLICDRQGLRRYVLDQFSAK